MCTHIHTSSQFLGPGSDTCQSCATRSSCLLPVMPSFSRPCAQAVRAEKQRQEWEIHHWNRHCPSPADHAVPRLRSETLGTDLNGTSYWMVRRRVAVMVVFAGVLLSSTQIPLDVTILSLKKKRYRHLQPLLYFVRGCSSISEC